jgi:hypothetical protein
MKTMVKPAPAKPATTRTNDDHSRQFFLVAERMRRLSESCAAWREFFRIQSPGRYERVTVCRVKSHQVRAYWREGFTAVRVRRNPQ